MRAPVALFFSFSSVLYNNVVPTVISKDKSWFQIWPSVHASVLHESNGFMGSNWSCIKTFFSVLIGKGLCSKHTTTRKKKTKSCFTSMNGPSAWTLLLQLLRQQRTRLMSTWRWRFSLRWRIRRLAASQQQELSAISSSSRSCCSWELNSEYNEDSDSLIRHPEEPNKPVSRQNGLDV